MVYHDTLPVRPGNNPNRHLNIYLGRSAAGRSHYYHVFLETRAHPWQIQWYFDFQKKYTRSPAAVSFGKAIASSERQTWRDNNWAHWMELKRNEGPTVTAPWSTFNVYWDDDPNYYAQAVTTTEFYV